VAGVEQKRQAIRQAYSSDSWKEKTDKMSDRQVEAIYIRLLSEGKLG
jgi:hypothetical protein